MQNVEEYIVQKGVVLDGMVKRWIFCFHGVGKTLLVVKKATCPSNSESETVNNCNIAYDIVRQHTISYVSIRCRTSAYDVVRQHTRSYVSIRFRTSAYDVVRQHTISYVSIRCRTSAYDIAYDMQHVGDNMDAAWGAGFPQRRACRLFWHCCSRFPKHVVLPFWT